MQQNVAGMLNSPLDQSSAGPEAAASASAAVSSAHKHNMSEVLTKHLVKVNVNVWEYRI